MKNRGFSTRAIHGRAPPDAPGEPVVQPIVTATTFSFDDAATFGRVMSEEEYGFLYSRLRNPTVEELNGVLADLEAIAATKGDGLMIVDNTFASPALCRPLELGVDIVCESATKYLNGHHDVTAGVFAGSAEAVARARAWQIDTGAVLDAFPAYLLRRGLKTLALRMERHCANALTVARFLEGHSRTKRVYYAGLESYPQHELAKRQLAGFGGMLAAELDGGREAGESFMNGLELCKRATSLGGVDTVVSHPASTSHRQFSEEQLAAAGITPGLLRVSIGCEDADDIVADFGNALERL